MLPKRSLVIHCKVLFCSLFSLSIFESFKDIRLSSIQFEVIIAFPFTILTLCIMVIFFVCVCALNQPCLLKVNLSRGAPSPLLLISVLVSVKIFASVF